MKTAYQTGNKKNRAGREVVVNGASSAETTATLPKKALLRGWARKGKDTVKLAAPALGKVARSQKKILTWLRKKRNERLTLMFIPHNELKIRNYHVSNLTLIIATSVLGLVLLISAFLVI